MRKDIWMVALGLALAAAGPARADVWDVQTNSDNSAATTHNELVHGSDQIHDLGVLISGLPDQDWYTIGQKAQSSYEVIVDATSGDIGVGVLLQRFAADGTTLLQTSVPVTVGLNYSQSLRFMNTTGAEVADQFVRVMSSSCNTNCGPDDVYRLRAFETTMSIPRFNNSASQITVLLLQNPSGYAINGDLFFWHTDGTLIGAPFPFSLPAKNTLVLNTATVPGVAGQGGAITLANDGRYGDLSGKTVALEPATGFSFDSPMVPRVN
jgi:hypothetical protein